MSAVALLHDNPHPDDDAIDDAMRGNICRCGMYGRVRRAIHRASAQLGGAVQQFDPAVSGKEVRHG